MEKKIMIMGVVFFTLVIGGICLYNTLMREDLNLEKTELVARVLGDKGEMLVIQGSDNVIYTIDKCDSSLQAGDNILLEYTGIRENNVNNRLDDINSCNVIYTMSDEDLPTDFNDEGMFSKYYNLAYQKVKEMSLEEVIAQVLLVRYPDNNQVAILEKYQFGGYVFFEKDFKDKTKNEVINMMEELQEVAKIPILTAVDEEGGKVVRISSNTNLRSEKFASSQSLYQEGGFSRIKSDTIEKSNLLMNLGINLNLAPVVDVANDSNAYMYERTLEEGTELTATYAKTVIEASKGTGVSYTLKHFPGYGNNTDTHIGTVSDNRSYEEIVENDLPPFESGIEAGAEAVLVSHNVVTSLDNDNPASLSASVHNLLRNQLDFTGIIITDDLSMGATSALTDKAVKAILAGNDLLITSDYEGDIADIKSAINKGTLAKESVEKMAMRVIAWKYYKGLLLENQK